MNASDILSARTKSSPMGSAVIDRAWLCRDGYLVTCKDGSVIDVPHRAGHDDYRALQEWVAAGGAVQIIDDYATLRRRAYPPLAEQLDALWKGGTDADTMQQRIMDVKTRFPK